MYPKQIKCNTFRVSAIVFNSSITIIEIQAPSLYIVSRLTSLASTESTVDLQNKNYDIKLIISLGLNSCKFLAQSQRVSTIGPYQVCMLRACLHACIHVLCTLLQTSEVSFITRAAVHQPPVCRACEPTLLPESRQIFGINVFKHKSHFILHIYGYIFTTLSL